MSEANRYDLRLRTIEIALRRLTGGPSDSDNGDDGETVTDAPACADDILRRIVLDDISSRGADCYVSSAEIDDRSAFGRIRRVEAFRSAAREADAASVYQDALESARSNRARAVERGTWGASCGALGTKTYRSGQPGSGADISWFHSGSLDTESIDRVVDLYRREVRDKVMNRRPLSSCLTTSNASTSG